MCNWLGLTLVYRIKPIYEVYPLIDLYVTILIFFMESNVFYLPRSHVRRGCCFIHLNYVWDRYEMPLASNYGLETYKLFCSWIMLLNRQITVVCRDKFWLECCNCLTHLIILFGLVPLKILIGCTCSTLIIVKLSCPCAWLFKY